MLFHYPGCSLIILHRVSHIPSLRTGRDGGGISPDYFIPLDTTGRSDWLYVVLAENMINTFVFDYVDAHKKELSKYKSAAEFDDKFKINERIFNNFIEITKNKGIKGSVAEIETSKDWIHMRLKALIARNKWNDEGFYRAVNKDDRMMIKALDVFYETAH